MCLQCVWRLALSFDRKKKTERKLARARISIVSSQQHDKQQQVREECTCLVHVQDFEVGASAYSTWPWRVAHIFWNFKAEIHVHILKAPADFQKPYGGHPGTKWRVVYMGNCTHFHPGTSFKSVIWTELKVVPG